MAIDRGADRTACRQLADQLREAIGTGVLGPGDMVPSPSELAEDAGVHTDTARRAIAILRGEGLVRTVPGHGSVVAGEDPVRTHEVMGPARISVRMPSQVERQELDIPEGCPLLIVERPGDGEITTEQHLGHQTVLEVPPHR
jgi:DNA-binding transcriptional regulator YhcF (GntR family)